MRVFRRPSLAEIYIKQLRGVDEAEVPLFEPTTPVTVGTIGRFEHGRFVKVGDLDEHDLELETDCTPSRGSMVLGGDQGVTITPHANLDGPGGATVLTATLEFSRRRSVLAAFKDVETTVSRSPRSLDRVLWHLYATTDLAPDEVVVWSVKRAMSGTVIVNRKRGTTMQIAADPTLLAQSAGLSSLASLAVGVDLSLGDQASYQRSLTTPLTVSIRAKGYVRRQDKIGEVLRYGDHGAAPVPDDELPELPELKIDRVLAEVDFDAEDDDEDDEDERYAPTE